MASTVAELQTIIDLIDDVVTARLTGDTATLMRIGEHEYKLMDIDKLGALRDTYEKQLQAASAGTEDWDKFHDGATRDGSDGTVFTGDDET